MTTLPLSDNELAKLIGDEGADADAHLRLGLSTHNAESSGSEQLF